MDSVEETKTEEKTLPRRTFFACAIGTSFFISATFSLSGLQSSINVRESLGTVSMTIRLVTATLGSLLVTPVVVKRYGPKTALIASELTDVLFTIANFYPSWYTMTTASAISGVGSSMIWVASGSILHSVASRSAKGKDVAVETQRLYGMFFGIMAVGQMLANAVTQCVLNYAFAGSSVTHGYNSSLVEDKDMSSCASRDCPAKYAFLNNTPKFEAFSPNQNSVYLLLSVYLIMQFTAVVIHSLILPAIPKLDDREGSDEELMSSEEHLVPRKASPWSEALINVKDVFAYFVSFQGFFTVPVQLQFGLAVSFVMAEFNRAFVSCVIGVEQVGACAAIVDFFYLLTSTVISRIAPRFGLISLMATGMLYDLINYTSSLLWVPNEATLFIPYLLSATYGISHGIRRNTSFLIVTRYSEDNETAFSAQAVTVCLGEIITFAWSTPLCVYVKIYAMIGLVILATTCWGVVEYRWRRQTQSLLL